MGKVVVNIATGFCGGKGALADIIVNIERVAGSRFADTLTGHDLDNGLFGGDGDGNDKIQFGSGNDYMRGGSGADEFFWVPTGSEVARIIDFTQGGDLINLSAVYPSFLTPERGRCPVLTPGPDQRRVKATSLRRFQGRVQGAS